MSPLDQLLADVREAGAYGSPKEIADALHKDGVDSELCYAIERALLTLPALVGVAQAAGLFLYTGQDVDFNALDRAHEALGHLEQCSNGCPRLATEESDAGLPICRNCYGPRCHGA